VGCGGFEHRSGTISHPIGTEIATIANVTEDSQFVSDDRDFRGMARMEMVPYFAAAMVSVAVAVAV